MTLLTDARHARYCTIVWMWDRKYLIPEHFFDAEIVEIALDEANACDACFVRAAVESAFDAHANADRLTLVLTGAASMTEAIRAVEEIGTRLLVVTQVLLSCANVRLALTSEEEEDAALSMAFVDAVERSDVLVCSPRVGDHELLDLGRLLRPIAPDLDIQSSDGVVDTFQRTHPPSCSRTIRELKTLECDERRRVTMVSPDCIAYRRDRPFHPTRLLDTLLNWPSQVIRAYGTLWVATRNHMATELDQRGRASMSLSDEGEWIATLSAAELIAARSEKPELFHAWDPIHGDRLTSIILLGHDISASKVIAMLDSCLLDDLEMRRDWRVFPDPLPQANEDEEQPLLRIAQRSSEDA